jgi:hypothetical protein
MKKTLSFILAALLLVSLLTACSGGIPDGRYEPNGYSTIEAIIVSGNNFTFTYALGAVSQTNKYTYKNGTITFQDGGSAVNVACTYDKGTEVLEWAGIKFKKVK